MAAGLEQVMPSLIKRLRDLRYKIFYGMALSRRFNLVTLGAPESICKWTICPTGLGPDSIIYSAGVGSELIDGCADAINGIAADVERIAP